MQTPWNRLRGSAKSILYPILKKRKCHAYCVSLPKSGTKSMAGLFTKNYRASHEKDTAFLSGLILDAASGQKSPAQMRRLLKRRDRRLWLEFDSSTLNYFILDILVEEFPDARFLLTLREPYSWLDSVFNHFLGRGLSRDWASFVTWWFEPDKYRYASAERALEERGLFPLDCYLTCWARHNTTVLSTVPASRLHVFRTDEIATKLHEVAEFLSIPVTSLDASHAHIHRAVGAFDVLSEIEPSYLRDRTLATCAPLMEKFFPDALERCRALTFS